MSSMKIAHIQHPYIPGMGYQENHLPNEQDNLSNEVTIFTSNFVPEWANTGHQDISAGIYNDRGVKIIRHQSTIKFRSIGKTVLSGLNQSLLDFDPDIIHAHGILSPSTLQAYRFAKKRNTPLFIDVHVDNGNFNLDNYAKNIAFSVYRLFCVPILVSYAEKILPVNPQAKSFLIDTLDVPEEKIELLPLGVPTTTFSPKRGSDQVREKLDIEDEDLLIISSGNLNSSKDIDILISSFSNYLNERRDVYLLLIGNWEQSYRSQLEDLVDRASIRENVIFHGAVENEQLPLFYNAADIGVWAGKLGVTILEAIGCGLPIIVSESKATDFLIDNNNGLSFDRGNTDDLYAKIKMYGERPELRMQHSKAARDYAVSELDWNEIAKKSIQIYESSYKNNRENRR